MIMCITISNSQVFLLGFSLWKYSLDSVGNEGIYSVGKEFGKTLFILPNKEFREYLARRPKYSRIW